MKKATTKSYALRIDGPLVKPLQELKKRNRRSLNAEINAALEAWVAGAQRQTATPEAASATSSGNASPVEAAPKQARAKKQAKRQTSGTNANAEMDTNSTADSRSDAAPEPAAVSDPAASETNA